MQFGRIYVLSNQHRDVCSAMRINIRFHFRLGLLAGKWQYKELRLPTQEGICLIINNVPDVGGVMRAKVGDPYYVPARS